MTSLYCDDHGKLEFLRDGEVPDLQYGFQSGSGEGSGFRLKAKYGLICVLERNMYNRAASARWHAKNHIQ